MAEPDCKDIGKVYITVREDGKKATIDILNAYPGYYVVFDMEIQNTGDIPWRLWFAKLIETDEIWHSEIGWIPLDIDEDGCVEAYLSFDESWFGRQIDPNDSNPPDISWKIYFTNCIEEGETFSFNLWLYYLNWNEWFKPGAEYGTWVGGFIPRGSLVPPLPAI